jgi:hypothetical protein
MKSSQVHNSLLIRFWFKTKGGLGIGVTAYSKADAEELIRTTQLYVNTEIVEVIEDIDIRELDQNHVIPNMGPPNFRGIWYPNISL